MSWWTKYTEVQVELAIANALAGGGPGTPSAPDTSVQFNNGGAFGGDANLLWDATGKNLNLGAAGTDIFGTSFPNPASFLSIFDLNASHNEALSLTKQFDATHVFTGSPTTANGAIDAASINFFVGSGATGLTDQLLRGIIGDLDYYGTEAIGQLRGIHYGVFNEQSNSPAAEIDGAYLLVRNEASGTASLLIGYGAQVTNLGTVGDAAYGAVVTVAGGTAPGYGFYAQVSGSSAYAFYGNSAAHIEGFLEGIEQAEPAAPAANGYRIFAKDTGGKTELLVRFNSGASQQIAIEP